MKLVILELKIRYREYFESRLAQFFFDHQDLMRAPVVKISAGIRIILLKNKTRILREISDNPKVQSALFDPFFLGHLTRRSEDPEQIFDQIIASLDVAHNTLYTVMHLHNTFIQRLYDCIDKSDEDIQKKTKLVASLFPNDYFSEHLRPRNKINNSLTVTHQLGITRNAVYSKRMGAGPSHVKGYTRYQFTGLTLFEKNAQQDARPYLCGPSGNTGSLLLGANLYGHLVANEMQIYSLLCFSFLALAGSHSFSETMMIAKLIGLNYQENSYLESIPEEIQTHPDFEELYAKFNQFFS